MKRTVSFRKRILPLFLLTVLIFEAVTQPAQVFAQAKATDSPQQFYADNGIIWYDKNAGKCTQKPDGSGAFIPKAENPPPEKWPETVWAFLRSKELSPEQAAGVMGNIQQESTYQGKVFNPFAEENPGSGTGGYGLAQWTGSRRTDLANAATAAGVPMSSIYLQLEFLYTESAEKRMSKTIPGIKEWEGLKQQTSVMNATVYFHDNFERSADTPEFVRRVRGGNAQKWFDEFNNKVVANTGACGSQDATGLAAKTREYAWPQYTPSTTNKKPEYATAVQAALDAKPPRYVGGGAFAGVDCGGFVTLLMQDSGFEPKYNTGPQGNTIQQKEWLDANWENMGLADNINTALIEPGWVAMSPSHTFVFVGKSVSSEFGAGDPAFQGVASASYGGTGAPWRAPMAGHESLKSTGFTWYKKK